MFDRTQFVASRFGEVGVQSQYLDGELHFVDNSLARPVSTRKQFEVFNPVVLAVPVDVVHGFFRKKIAAKMFRHLVTMFHDRVFFPCHEGWNAKPNVPVAFGVPSYVAGIKTSQGFLSLVFGFASAITKFLLCVNPTSRFSALALLFTALNAGKASAQHRIFATAGVRAGHRAVKRFFSKFLLVSTKIGRFHSESFAAFFACKFDRSFSRSGASVRGFMFSNAGGAAKATRKVTRFDSKLSSAMFAFLFNGHVERSCVGTVA